MPTNYIVWKTVLIPNFGPRPKVRSSGATHPLGKLIKTQFYQ